MSLYRRGRIWHYDFFCRGRRYRGSTEEASKCRAKRMEAQLMFQVREKRGFIPTSHIPILSEFAPQFLDWVQASTLEPSTKRYYRYGWQMLEKTNIAGMQLGHICTDAAGLSLSMVGFRCNPHPSRCSRRFLRD